MPDPEELLTFDGEHPDDDPDAAAFEAQAKQELADLAASEAAQEAEEASQHIGAALAEPSPAPGDDASPADPDDGELRLRGKLTTPEDTNDVYIVLWAYKPPRGVRPRYEEVGYFSAAGPDQARARAIEHDGRTKKPLDERGETARQLIAAAEQRGILLRALPARHWLADCPVTGMVRPAPILTLDG